MGMYDDVDIKLRMPDGFESNDYQSKDLDCMLDQYEVNAAGRLIRIYVGGIVDEDFKRPAGDVNFNGILNIYTSFFTRKRHEYDLEFVDGTLKVIHCHQTKIQMLFEPLETVQRTLATDPIQVSEADMQHHLKYIGRTGGFKHEDGTPRVPSPQEVVELGWEPKSNLEQFKAF